MERDEQVFVVERAAFFGGDWPQGFAALDAPPSEGTALLAALEREGFFAPRAVAEQRPAWKQLIPYCLVRRTGDLLCVQRLRRQSEGRLHGLWSIGFGGHVNPEDGAPPGVVGAALARELREELVIPAGEEPRPRLLGLLNDDSTDVGRVHAGLVYLWDISATAHVAIRETAKMRGGFHPLEELGAEPPSAAVPERARVVPRKPVWQDSAFESWSAIMLESGLRTALAAREAGSR